MTPFWGHTEIVAEFVGSRIEGCERGFGPCQGMGVLDRDGRLVAGVVYNDWDTSAGVIQLSAASIDKRWLTRPVLREMFAYPFDLLGCQMVVFRVHPDNLPMRRMLGVIGGREYEIERLRGRDTSEIIVTVTEEAWRQCKFGGYDHAERKRREAVPDAPRAAAG